MRSAAIILLLVSFMASTCKKYEEGPAFSFRSKKARATGDWQLKKWIIDGQEQDLSSVNWSLTIHPSGNYDKTVVYNIPPVGPTYDVENGTWEFDKKKKYILFRDQNNPAGVPQEIIRLMHTELWLRFTDNGTTEEYQYALIR